MKIPMRGKFGLFILVSLFCLTSCTKAHPTPSYSSVKPEGVPKGPVAKLENPGKVVHVLVALCDNEAQGIVPVPARLGDGEDPARNLYWGAAYGVKTFFSKSANWQKIAVIANPKEHVLERIVFRHRRQNVYLVADAYRGSRIKETINDFFAAAAGASRENVTAGDLTLQVLGGARLVAFVGHNGLMDFALDGEPRTGDGEERDAVILACASRNYFARPLKQTSAKPLLWTTNLMAPEAYILHDALEGWAEGENSQAVRRRAAAAYAKYQKISIGAAQNLLVTGW